MSHNLTETLGSRTQTAGLQARSCGMGGLRCPRSSITRQLESLPKVSLGLNLAQQMGEIANIDHSSSFSTVPVPVHWSAKREYLSGKRGIEKPPFQLPSMSAFLERPSQRVANVHLPFSQPGLPTLVSPINEMLSRKRRPPCPSSKRPGRGFNPRWARSISTTRSCTTRSSDIRPSHRCQSSERRECSSHLRRCMIY